MKTIQRFSVPFGLILFLSMYLLASSYGNTSDDWLLLHDPLANEINAFNPETQVDIPISKIPNTRLIQWVSPNGKWLYFYWNGWLWAHNIFTEQSHEIAPCISDDCENIDDLLSPQHELMFLFDNYNFKRLDPNSAKLVDVNVDMTPYGENPALSSVQYLRWIENGEAFETHWGTPTRYRISYDGSLVEPLEMYPEHISPDREWELYSQDDQLFISNRRDNTIYPAPLIPSIHISTKWFPNNTLIVKFVDRNLNTIITFSAGQWTMLIENKKVYGILTDQSSPLSPDYRHLVYFEPTNRLHMMNLESGSVLSIDDSASNQVWNDDGAWFAYLKDMGSQQMVLSVYDVSQSKSTNFYTYPTDQSSAFYKPVVGTKYLIFLQDRYSSDGQILINVKTGQTVQLNPYVEVISKWTLPDFAPPRYELHTLIALLLLGLPTAAKVARRKLSA